MDLHGLDFAEAWDLTRGVISYTNHTLLPEALETWPVPLFERLLPRHMQIIYEINGQLLKEARARAQVRRRRRSRSVSLIDEYGERRVRMGNLAFVGVALDQRRLGAAHRADEGDGVRRPPPDVSRPDQQQDQRHHPAALADAVQSRPDRAPARDDRRRVPRRHRGAAGGRGAARRRRRSRTPSRAVKRPTRTGWRSWCASGMGIRVDPNALFDIQIKRIHEYKRQLLNIIEAVALYDQIRSHPERNWVPRVKFFAGKAAPSYHNAKLIIKLANDVGRVINANPAVRGRAEGGVPAELQRQPRRGDGAGGRPLRADLDRRHGGVGHRQHEVRAERRADHRHARRRQRRDPRAGRAPRTS